MSDSLQPHGLYSPWDSPGQNTGVGSLSLLQGTFPTQGLNPGLPHFRQILYQLSHKGSPRTLEWVAYPFSSRSCQPRNRTGSPAWQEDSLPTELSGNPRSPVGVSISSRSHGRWGKTREVPDCIFCVCVRMIPPCFTISQSQTRKWLNTLLTLKPSSSLLPFLKFPGSISHFLCCASPVLYGNI